MNDHADDDLDLRYRAASGVLVKLGQLDSQALIQLARGEEASKRGNDGSLAKCREAAIQTLSNGDSEVYRWASRRCMEMVEYAVRRDNSIHLTADEILYAAAAASDTVLDELVVPDTPAGCPVPLLAQRWREVAGEPAGGSDIRDVMKRASPSATDERPARPFCEQATSPPPIHEHRKGAARQALTPAQVRFRARTSLACGIVGLLCLGVIAGVPAITLGRSARRQAPLGVERDTAFVAELGSLLGWLSIISTAVAWLVIVGQSN